MTITASQVWVAVLVPGIWWLFCWTMYFRRPAAGYFQMVDLCRRRQRLRMGLLGLALTLCAISLTGPSKRGPILWKQRGFDLVLVLQFSESMLAQDVYPSRLRRSLAESDRVLEGLGESVQLRLSTILYAGGEVHFPLTHDIAAAQSLYRGVTPKDLVPGADLELALRRATCILASDRLPQNSCHEIGIKGGEPLHGRKRQQAKSEAPAISERGRVILLFSDGSDSQDGTAERLRAEALGLEVFVVHVGDQNPNFMKNANPRFSLGATGLSGQSLLAALKKVQRGNLQERRIVKQIPLFEWFLFPAFLLLILHSCLSERKVGA